MVASTLVVLAAVAGAWHTARAQSADCSPDLPDPNADRAGSIPLSLDLSSLPGAGRFAASPLQALSPRVRGYARGMNGGVTADGLQGGGLRGGVTADGLRGGMTAGGLRGGMTADGLRGGTTADGRQRGLTADGFRGVTVDPFGSVAADSLRGVTADGLNGRRIDRGGNRGMNGGATTGGPATGGVTGQVFVDIPTAPSRRAACVEPAPLDDVLQGEPGDVLHGEPAGDLLRGDRPRRRVGTVQIETPSRP